MLNDHLITDEMLHNITWEDVAESKMVYERTRRIFREFKPKTYQDIYNMIACGNNVYFWEDSKVVGVEFEVEKLREVLTSDAFKKCPCYVREELTEYMVATGYDHDAAFFVSEMIRKGYANSFWSHHKLEAADMPPEVRAVARFYWYVTSRPRVEELLKMIALEAALK